MDVMMRMRGNSWINPNKEKGFLRTNSMAEVNRSPIRTQIFIEITKFFDCCYWYKKERIL